MENDDSFVVQSAPNYEREDDTVDSCTTCNRLLDAAHRIVDMSIQKRDHGMELRPDWHGLISVGEIGVFSNILTDPNCERHQDFLRSTFLIHKVSSWQSTIKTKLEASWDPDKDRAVLSDVSTVDGLRGDREILLLDFEPHLSAPPCMGRPRDEDFISIDLMSQWISSCEMGHKTSCCVQTLPSMTLSWVVDTKRLCLVPAEHGTRYIALSYVWGQTKMLKNTQETVRSLQTVGALSETSNLMVPRVIRHAISLAAQLGQRYLWVDSLCIMQDDNESLNLHVRHMASIFEAALFTIVAADGMDAEHGILGIKGISEPRTIPKPVLKLEKRLGMRSRGRQNILNSPWGHRGWTLQEHIFSKRKLIFVHGSVQWICQETRCFEDIFQDSLSNRKKRKQEYGWDQELESVGEIALTYPVISQIEEVLWQYTGRNLTFGNDVIRAIEAVFTACGEAYPSGFFMGLPVDFFDMALLWCHSGSDVSKPKRRTAASPDTQPPFPSWTWAGWVGKVNPGTWFAATYIKDANETNWSGRKCSTIPMLEWQYRSDVYDSERPIRGQNNAYAYKLKFMGKEDGLPLGWKYEREPLRPNQEDSAPEDYTTEDEDYYAMATPYYYSHESAPDIKFWHPVPISTDVQEATTPPIDSRFLCARTQSGRLWVTTVKRGRPVNVEADVPGSPVHGDPRFVRLFGEEVSPDALLVDTKGELVGDLYINAQDDRDLVERFESQPDEAGYPCELAAISKGNDSVHPLEPGKENFTFYNVLWINWEDGIAYRRGVGRVKRETWESIELEDVDLILG